MPFDELESPFLEHEPVAARGEKEFATPLGGGLEAESPFLSALEPGSVGVLELEEEEENQLADKPCLGIIGHHDRVAVPRASDIPYRWICQISSWHTTRGKRQFGPVSTGVLISPRFVLTAAHVLNYSEKDNRGQWVDSKADRVVVTPARNDNAPAGSKAPVGQYEARVWRCSPRYNPRSRDQWKYDYAIIELKQPAGAQRAAILNNNFWCFWGSRECGRDTDLRVLGATDLEGTTAYTAGYPHDLGHGTRPYSTSGKLTGVEKFGRHEIMNYDADMCPGQSGSPIWIEWEKKRCLVGIATVAGSGHDVTTGRVTANHAIRITQEVFDQISHWLEGVLETPWLGARESAQEESTNDSSHETEVQELDSSPEAERGDDSEAMQLEDEQAEGQLDEFDTPVIVEHDVSKTPVRRVAVGERVDLDLSKTAQGADLDQVRWIIPGRVVGGYEGTLNAARLIELTQADLKSPATSFFWVDAGNGRTVRARIGHTSGAHDEFVPVFDVEGPKMIEFSGTPGVTRIDTHQHGTVGLWCGNPPEAPGVVWHWKITMPPHYGTSSRTSKRWW